MIMYRLIFDVDGEPVTFTRMVQQREWRAPVTGDFLRPSADDDLLFEVTARMWEMPEPAGVIVMARPAGPPLSEAQPIPDGCFDRLIADGWERSP